MAENAEAAVRTTDPAARVHRWVVLIIVAIMAIDLVVVLVERQWLNALLTLTIGSLLLVFVFAALFLGEVRSFYVRYWWWDIVLHTASGFLLGIFGFLLVYVLNESKVVAIQMLPRFVALFAFLFAVAVGALWEIFEFTMDRTVGTRMQKPMLGDASGLTDTMWDLIVDTVGATAIALLGWWRMVSRQRSFIDVWIEKFVDQNPRLFSRKLRHADESGQETENS